MFINIKSLIKALNDLKDLTFKSLSHKGEILNNANNHADILVQGQLEGTVFIKIVKSELNNPKERIKIGLYSGNKLIETFKINFQGPIIIK